MNKLNFLNKSNGDPLEAEEWNLVVGKIDELVEASNESGGSSGTPIDTQGIISVSSKGNVTLGSNKNVNIEPVWNNNTSGYSGNYGDIALKPGDDIQFCSHHREPKKRDKIVIKNIDGSDNPVKFEMQAGEITLSTQNKVLTYKKDKTTGADTSDKMFKSDNAKVMDINVITGNILDADTNNERNERGYLKVRAQAIDLRCEKHGGIALQPKGYDSDGNMNKIKFEHGGGDGLEFGTFNTEKTSIFTNEYRFNKEGIWKMAVREKEASEKNIIDEREGGLQGLGATGEYKYKKNNTINNLAKSLADYKTYEPADDFYDFIDEEDALTTTESIIKTAASFNNDLIKTSLSSKKNLKISSNSTYKILVVENLIDISERLEEKFTIGLKLGEPTFSTKSYLKDELKEIINTNNIKLSSYIGTDTLFVVSIYMIGGTPPLGNGGFLCKIVEDITPKISLESEKEIDIDVKYGDVVITSGDTIKMEAPEIRLNAINEDKSGGIINFGATLDIVFLTNKLTKSLNVESAANPTSIKILLLNNYLEPVYWDTIEQVFRIPLKKLYLDDSHVTELTPSNYANGLDVYFADGTKIPADYTCYMGYTTENSGTYTTTIYKVGTKGSEDVLKKNLGEAVAQYTSSSVSSLGAPVFNNTTNIKFELSNYVAGADVDSIASGEFVTIDSIELSDIITLVNYFKTGIGRANGPWAENL